MIRNELVEVDASVASTFEERVDIINDFRYVGHRRRLPVDSRFAFFDIRALAGLVT